MIREWLTEFATFYYKKWLIEIYNARCTFSVKHSKGRQERGERESYCLRSPCLVPLRFAVPRFVSSMSSALLILYLLCFVYSSIQHKLSMFI